MAAKCKTHTHTFIIKYICTNVELSGLIDAIAYYIILFIYNSILYLYSNLHYNYTYS